MSAIPGLIATAVQVGIGLVLAVSGFGKLGQRHEFRGIVEAYRIVPAPAVPTVAMTIVITEIGTGTALVAGLTPDGRVFGAASPVEGLARGAGPLPVFALIAAALFAGFAVAMAVNLLRGRRMIDCGCFRSIRQPLEWRLVVRNALCALAALATSAFPMSPADPQRWLHAVPAGIALFVLYFAMNAVWALDASRATAFPRS